MAEKDFSKRRQQSLQASILEAVCLELLVQDIDEQLIQSQRQRQRLNAHKKCLPLKTDLEPSSLAQWLGDNAGLTTQLVEEVIEPYAARRAEHLSAGTTWNEAAKRASQKHKPWAITTGKTVVPHPEEIPSLLQRVTENKSLNQNDDMIIDEPDHSVASSSTRPIIISDNMAVLPYEDKLYLST